MKKLFLICIVLIATFKVKSQIYGNVKELRPFTSELEGLEILLRSDPIKFSEHYSLMYARSVQEKNEHLKSILLIYQGSNHYYVNAIDSAIFYFDEAIELSKSIKCPQLELAAKIRRIFCDEDKLSIMRTSREMHQVFIKAYNQNDTINMIYSLNGLALFHDRMDSTEKSLQYYYGALQLAEQSNNKAQEGFVLNNLGLLKMNLGATDSAYADFNKGLEIARSIKDLRLESHLRINMGEYYLDLDSLKQAEEEYNYVLNMGMENGYRDMVIAAIINISNLEHLKQNYSKSDSLYKYSLEFAKKEKILNTISVIYVNQANLYREMGKFDEALQILDSSLIYAEYLSIQKVELIYHQYKFNILKSQGRYKKSLEEFEIYNALKDSITEIGNSQTLDELQYRYRDEKKERIQLQKQKKYELQIKQNEINLANFKLKILLLVGFLIIVVAFGLIMYFRLKQKSDNLFSSTIVNKLEEERGKIARDLHDGLGQSMIILKNKYGKIKNNDFEDTNEFSENISEIIEEIRGISRSLIPPELRRLGLVKSIEKIMNEIEESTDILVTTDIEDLNKINLEIHQNLRLYRIIQELTTNTLKHSGADAVKLEAVIEESNTLTVIYQDNGTGINIEKWKSAKNSVGFKSIEQRLKYLKGSIKIEKPKKGFKVIIKIKKVC